MSEAVVASETPYSAEVREGKTYFWCRCGRSKKQPFCDGSHTGTSFDPVPYKANADEVVYFCGCKQTGAQPLCDGSHAKLG